MKSIQPWESSAEVFTSGAIQLGLSDKLHFEEVFSLEDSLPAQTVALILVYPTSSNYEEQKAKEATSLQGSADAIELRDLDVLWLSQKVQNACGPYALFHAVFNSSSRHHVTEDSLLHKLEQRLSKASSSEMRSAALEAYSEVWTTCLEIGKMGVTPLLEDDGEDVEPHFVCFAAMRGNLGFFDGDRTHGPKDLGIKLGCHGFIPDQALEAVKNHLETYAGDKRDFSTLLALVNTALK